MGFEALYGQLSSFSSSRKAIHFLALVRCHTEIDNVNELTAKIHPRVCINMQADGAELELTYSVDGDPEFRGYFVTLRDWQIVEVCMAE